jgi:hypothetical protein
MKQHQARPANMPQKAFNRELVNDCRNETRKGSLPVGYRHHKISFGGLQPQSQNTLSLHDHHATTKSTGKLFPKSLSFANTSTGFRRSFGQFPPSVRQSETDLTHNNEYSSTEIVAARRPSLLS